MYFFIKFYIAFFVVNHNYLDLRQMSWEELGHAEGSDAITSENFGHLLVWGEELLVLGVLEVVLLQVGPKLFDTLSPGCFLLSDNVSKVSWQLHGLGESWSFSWHGWCWFKKLVFQTSKWRWTLTCWYWSFFLCFLNCLPNYLPQPWNQFQASLCCMLL